ncbi:hypothetical protein MRX96_001248 [Rhipicephalus microplus]
MGVYVVEPLARAALTTGDHVVFEPVDELIRALPPKRHFIKLVDFRGHSGDKLGAEPGDAGCHRIVVGAHRGGSDSCVGGVFLACPGVDGSRYHRLASCTLEASESRKAETPEVTLARRRSLFSTFSRTRRSRLSCASSIPTRLASFSRLASKSWTCRQLRVPSTSIFTARVAQPASSSGSLVFLVFFKAVAHLFLDKARKCETRCFEQCTVQQHGVLRVTRVA